MSINNTEEYKYRMGDLVAAFNQNGMKVSQSWIYRQEKKGLMILPRSTTNIKHPRGSRVGSVRMMTKSQINEIVKAFLPGGIGKYTYKKGGVN